MPNVTTYIRKDDMELWLNCPNKAELIHNALHEGITVTVPRIEVAPPSYKLPRTKVNNPFDETKGIPNTSETTLTNIPGVTTADKLPEVTYKKTGSWGA